jgi:hypothetical protein
MESSGRRQMGRRSGLKGEMEPQSSEMSASEAKQTFSVVAQRPLLTADGSMETMMQVSILGRRPIPAGSGTVPTVAMDLHFRENGWTHTETISVTQMRRSKNNSIGPLVSFSDGMASLRSTTGPSSTPARPLPSRSSLDRRAPRIARELGRRVSERLLE